MNIVGVDLLVDQNEEQCHTDEYESEKYLILRRGSDLQFQVSHKNCWLVKFYGTTHLMDILHSRQLVTNSFSMIFHTEMHTFRSAKLGMGLRCILLSSTKKKKTSEGTVPMVSFQ